MSTFINNFNTSRDTTFRNRVKMAMVEQATRDARADFAGSTPTALELAIRETAQNILRSINREEVIERGALYIAQDLNLTGPTQLPEGDDTALRRSAKRYYQAISSELDTTAPV